MYLFSKVRKFALLIDARDRYVILFHKLDAISILRLSGSKSIASDKQVVPKLLIQECTTRYYSRSGVLSKCGIASEV
eukprot:scaffold229433_cov19-Prasinocladus_malaysianus.AAC.1